MAGPWEKYQSSSSDDGPWNKYSDNQFPKSSQGGGKLPFGAAAKMAFGILPQVRAAKWAFRHPDVVLPMAGAGLGSMLGPAGTAAGAGLGQIGSRMIDIAKGSPVQSPLKESIGPMVQSGLGGLSEVSGVLSPGTKTLSQRAGNYLAKSGETLSGAKIDILKQAFKQGYSTYGAPSLEKAQDIFGEALGPEGKQAMKRSVNDVFDSELKLSRSTAKNIGSRIERGEVISATDALKARQATDDIISSTSPTDKNKLNALYKWRKTFDDALSSQSGPLSDASKMYRKAIVKDTLLNPSRITKSGRPSAFFPMVLGAGSRGLAGVGMGLGATSPAVWGLGATTAGEIPAPVAQGAIASTIQKLLQKRRQARRSEE